MDRIILNYLPPGHITYPSAAFSILKSFMEKNGYEVLVKYWSFDLFEFAQELFFNIDFIKSKDLTKIMPFLCKLAYDEKDELCKKKLIPRLSDLRNKDKRSLVYQYDNEYLDGEKTKK